MSTLKETRNEQKLLESPNQIHPLHQMKILEEDD